MSSTTPEWFDNSGGLRFKCTCCGNCCTGPEGYVLFTHDEADALAAHLGIPREEFLREYTRATSRGRSLKEKKSPFGLDCIFLDRDRIPGRAVCGVYQARPAQCRTWPFWKSNLTSESAWRRAARGCPGMNQGKLAPPQQIRILRDTVDI